MDNKKKIIIVEDLVILNDILKKELQDTYNVVATCYDASLMLELCDKYKPDIVLTDIVTENNQSGILNGKKVKEKYGNQIKVLAMTGVLEVNFLNSCKEANLDGFIYKNIDSDTLKMFIEQVLNGYKLFPDNISFTNDNLNFKKLTNKEMEILRLLCSGFERKEIAEKLDIAQGTLKNHISQILEKMEFDSITNLLIFCISNGYIIPKLK